MALQQEREMPNPTTTTSERAGVFATLRGAARHLLIGNSIDSSLDPGVSSVKLMPLSDRPLREDVSRRRGRLFRDSFRDRGLLSEYRETFETILKDGEETIEPFREMVHPYYQQILREYLNAQIRAVIVIQSWDARAAGS